MKDKMYGNIGGWATHLLVATGKTDWVRDVADEKGSLMEAIERGGVEPSNGVGIVPDGLFRGEDADDVETQIVGFEYTGTG